MPLTAESPDIQASLPEFPPRQLLFPVKSGLSLVGEATYKVRVYLDDMFCTTIFWGAIQERRRQRWLSSDPVDEIRNLGSIGLGHRQLARDVTSYAVYGADVSGPERED